MNWDAETEKAAASLGITAAGVKYLRAARRWSYARDAEAVARFEVAKDEAWCQTDRAERDRLNEIVVVMLGDRL